MSTNPANLRYAKTHEWARLEPDGTVVVGITDHAQDLMGDMVFVDLPQIGVVLKAGKDCAVVESVKAASDVYAPISGEVVEINNTVANAPEVLNKDPYGQGWLFRLRPADTRELDALMDAKAYGDMVAAEEDKH